MSGYKFIFSLGVALIFFSFASVHAFQGDAFSKEDFQRIIHVKTQSPEDTALSFIADLAKNGIGIIEKADISDTARKKEFRKLLQTSFDMPTIARFSLGRYWRTSSKAEQKEYLKLFEDMIVEVYSRRFGEYNGEKIDVLSARPEGKTDHIVSSVLVPQNGPKISILWRVRKNKSGRFKVVDVIVEGVSMSLTQRSDFASVIQRGGGKVEVLLAHLRQNKN